MATREDIVAEARTWIDVRWLHQGRTVRGVDCMGVVVKVAHGCELSEADTDGYVRNAQGRKFMEGFRRHCTQKPISEMRPGDILIFRSNTYPCHCGIYAEKDYGDGYLVPSLIHAYVPRRKVVEQRLDTFDRTPLACFEYPGVED